MTAICPAGPPKLNAATRNQVWKASCNGTPCCGFHRSVIDSSANACPRCGSEVSKSWRAKSYRRFFRKYS